MGDDLRTERELSLDFLRVTEAAAIAAARTMGQGDRKFSDHVAVEAMREVMDTVPMRGRVVIGEGERDEAPMLYIGEEVGTGSGDAIDIALDPLEGTTLTAKAMANALAVIAFSPRGGMLHAPDTYMDKIAVGPGYPSDVVDLDAPADANAKALAKAKGVKVEDIGVCVLDRPRHAEIISALRKAGCRVYLITDGDVAGVINCTKPETGIDMYVGQGGAPEGVLAAAALKCVGGQFQGRLVFRNDDERARAERTGVTDFKRRYALNELVSKDAIFLATGVTNGSLLSGVRVSGGIAETHTLVLNSSTRTVSELRVKQPV